MLKAKPDKIEQEVFRVVSTIPEHAENWHDNRSSLRRFSEKRLSKNTDALRDEEIKEKWTMQIVLRLTELGKSLGYYVNDSHSVARFNENWMYDVIWRDLNRSGDWTLTCGLPLVNRREQTVGDGLQLTLDADHGATKWSATAATTHVPMAITAPTSLFGKRPRVINARAAKTVILAISME